MASPPAALCAPALRARVPAARNRHPAVRPARAPPRDGPPSIPANRGEGWLHTCVVRLARRTDGRRPWPPSRRPAEFGVVGCSLSLLFLAGFGGFTLLALALPLLGVCDLLSVVLQHATMTLLR